MNDVFLSLSSFIRVWGCILFRFNPMSVLCKEEWRDESRTGDTVANLFYPVDKEANKVILHINGSFPLLQDGR